MPDNVQASAGTADGAIFATANVTWSGDANTNIPLSGLLGLSGSEGSWTAAALPGDATDGLLVNLGGNNDISGTVTANLSATDNAVLDAIDAVLDTINAKLVTGTVIGDVNLGATDNAVLDAIAASLAGSLTVDGSGVTQPVSGTVTANLSATDNAVLDTIDAVLDAIKIDTEAIETAVEGTLTVDLGANNDVTATGSVANDAADSGNPVKIGAHATNSMEGETQVANNDRVDIKADLNGVVLTRTSTTLEELVSFYVANTDGAEDAVTGLDAGGAGIHNYITSITVHNAHASTNGFVSLLAGSGGAIWWLFPAPATGGTTMNFDPPLKQQTANQALYVDVSAAITTMHISIQGFQAQG